MKFRFISDPGHGWLEVPMSLIDLLGIKDKISQYSYRKGNMAYLEEDCDAYELISALKKEGISYEYEEIYQEVTPIRNYYSFF